MHIQLFSSIIILILTTLPTSLTGPPLNSLSTGPVRILCKKKPEEQRFRAPFPSHCRTLAGILRNSPDSTTPLIFDGRSDWPDQPHIPVPYRASYETCVVEFMPLRLDPSTRPGSNFAAYASFASAIERMNSCFTVRPGQESKDYVVAGAYYDQDVVSLGTEKWYGGMTGPAVANQAESANATAEGGGLDGTDLAEFWAILNGSTNGLVNGESGTAERGGVDVT